MAKSKTSKRWLREHFDDYWVKQAHEKGYRSRASFKLLEILKKDRLLKPGMTVIDLGAAPGGWSQVALEKVGEKGLVIASDILEMDPIAGVQYVQGDFTEQSVLDAILQVMGDRPVDVVISDMAPNLSGMKAVDQPRAMYLAELALDLAVRVLKPGGVFVTKVFQGEGFQEFRHEIQKHFEKLKSRKPEASRPRSTEQYLVAEGFRR